MKRSLIASQTITQANDAGCINNRRGMARRAKRHSSKKLRQLVALEFMKNSR